MGCELCIEGEKGRLCINICKFLEEKELEIVNKERFPC